MLLGRPSPLAHLAVRLLRGGRRRAVLRRRVNVRKAVLVVLRRRLG